MNRNYSFGKGSLEHITTTDSIMQNLCHEAMIICNKRKLHCPDWGVTCGKRADKEQLELFMRGRELHCPDWVVVNPSEVVTNCDGIIKRSIHQEGLAVDIYVVGEDRYDPAQLALVVTCFFEAADKLGVVINWGGNFQSFIDAPHIGIVGLK